MCPHRSPFPSPASKTDVMTGAPAVILDPEVIADDGKRTLRRVESRDRILG